MSAPQPDPTPKRRRAGVIALVSVLAAVVVAFLVVGVVTAAGTPSPTRTTPLAAGSGPVASSGPSASASPSTSSTVKPPAIVKTSSTPTPQPTHTTTLAQSTPQPIKKELTVKVTKVEAVTGVANGPGEIGGPSVRFTIEITNTTGKAVSLINTVVNAYYGAQSTPANALEAPGGAPFPRSVKTGRSASGVYVFNIPAKDRTQVEVTVDTAVSNPVVAFKGAAPK